MHYEYFLLIIKFLSGPILFKLSIVKNIAIKENYKIVTCLIISNIYNSRSTQILGTTQIKKLNQTKISLVTSSAA